MKPISVKTLGVSARRAPDHVKGHLQKLKCRTRPNEAANSEVEISSPF